MAVDVESGWLFGALKASQIDRVHRTPRRGRCCAHQGWSLLSLRTHQGRFTPSNSTSRGDKRMIKWEQ
ncbi:MAG: hypothetical protein QOJ06_2580 [Pseudonocardiales bacterium]|nr:hypothetical protein [Pseudonocardiales bacterium]